MMIEDPTDPEKQIEVYTVEEKVAIEAERDAAKADAEKYQRISAEKTENFKKLNDLTEAEKATYTAKELENMARVEAAEKRSQELEDRMNSDTQTRIASDTEKALAKFHGGNAELKKVLEDNFKIIALEGNDTDTINKRAEMAAAMYTGSTANRNPLRAGFSGGSSPTPPAEKNRTEEFLESDRGQYAQKMMGFDVTKK